MPAKPCIRCNDCAVVCPVGLQPQFLHAALNANAWEQTEKLKLDACLLCNACTSACPSEIDLRHQFVRGLATSKKIKTDHHHSLEAKKRFETREVRLIQQKELLALKRAEKLKMIEGLGNG